MPSKIQNPPSQWRVRRAERAKPKPVQIKGGFWYLLAFLAVIAWAMWATIELYSNREHIALGKSVECSERPSFQYFAFCNELADGPACSLASQSRMMHFYEPIDYACAQFEPDRVFRFPVNKEPETLEVAAVSG